MPNAYDNEFLILIYNVIVDHKATGFAYHLISGKVDITRQNQKITGKKKKNRVANKKQESTLF